jgi:hypothetical protein
MNPLHQGAYSFERIENARRADYARDFLLRAVPPAPLDIPTDLQKDLEVVKLRLLECRDARQLDVWLHSLLRIAELVNPALPAVQASALWTRIVSAPCVRSLHEFQRRWIALFQAEGARDARAMADIGTALLAESQNLGVQAREHLLMAAMSGAVAAGRPHDAAALWAAQATHLQHDAAQPVFRLLRCHATRGTSCVAAFSPHAVD